VGERVATNERGALSGLVVADFSRVLAGPLATMTLGDLGADVVKVERPEVGDDTRAWGPPFVEEGSTYYLGLNRNKRSITLDLAEAEDLSVARELATRADVLVENFRPGTMSRLGLGYAEVARVNPGIVYCSISAFGSGPEASNMPGYDFLAQAASGLMSITGEGGGPPLKVGVAVVDVLCGLHAALGIVAALRSRETTGRGQRVEVSLMDAALSALVNQASGYLIAGIMPGRLGNRHPSIAPYQTFEAADRPFVVAAGNDSLWQRLCSELGLEELAADERFATNGGRIAHLEDLEKILGAAFAEGNAATWVERLRRAGVPASPINDVGEAFGLAERLDMDPIVEVPSTRSDSILRLVRSPLRMSQTPVAIERPPPQLGEHSEEVREWLRQRPSDGSLPGRPRSPAGPTGASARVGHFQVRRQNVIEQQIGSMNFVGGEWAPADSGEVSSVINPSAPAEVVGTTPESGEAEARRAVGAAADAFLGWKATLPAERGAILTEASRLIGSRSEELARLMAREAGKPVKEARAEVARAAAIFAYYGSEGWRLAGTMPPSTRPGVQVASVREPLGVVALITPWNFPLAIPAWKVAPALVCGNTVVVKPAHNASLSAAALAGILAEAGLPDGVLNLVTGPGGTVGDTLVTDRRVKALSFTGSTAVGLSIQGRAVGKKVQLEMGGKNPYLVMEDADLKDAAAKIAFSAFGYAGQKCTAASRAIVVEEVYDEFLGEVRDAAEAMKVGDPLDEDAVIGPVVNRSQYDGILEALERAEGDGRVVLPGGATGPPEEGYFLAPAIFADVNNSSATAQEEVFGPVLAVVKARDFEHAVALANDTRYGLTAGISTRSLRYAHEFCARSETGLVNVNLPTAGLEFQVPFGGNKESGVGGREQGGAALDFYSAWKTLSVRPV